MNLYRLIMDPDINPLSVLPKAQRFQIMTYVSIIWVTIFCAIAGLWAFYGSLIVTHLMVALGFAITSRSFSTKPSAVTYRDVPRKDGSPRYDDVWGG